MFPVISERRVLDELDLTAESLGKLRDEILLFSTDFDEFASGFSSLMRNENAAEVLLTAAATIELRAHLNCLRQVLSNGRRRIEATNRKEPGAS